MNTGELINHRYVSDGGGALPAGGCFIVYPGKDRPVNSIWEEVFADGLRDYRALKTLEKYKGRKFVMDVLDKFGFSAFTTYPHEEKIFMQFIGKVHDLILQAEQII